jgi:hypothetical protein
VTGSEEPTPRPEPRAGFERNAPAVLGAILVFVGVVFLAGQLLNFDLGEIGWPFYVIAPGVAVLVLGLILSGGTPLIIGGSVATMVGLVLLYQNATDHWESWAYAWALVGPGAAGIGTFLAGARNGNPGMVRAGLWQAGTGVALFAAGLVFFEGIIGISGRRFPLPEWLPPAAIVALGAALIVWALIGRRSEGEEPPPSA